ncbi:hypothetical protein CR513_17356, partial [Mucuna pruriens]
MENLLLVRENGDIQRMNLMFVIGIKVQGNQGFRNLRKPSLRENKLRVGNDPEVLVESVGDINLVLDKLGLNFTFGDRKIILMLNSQIITFDNIPLSLVVENFGTKRFKIKEKSFMMWHKRLGHIFKEKVERLTKANILPSLNFDDFITSVDCIRRKFTKTKNKGATRSLYLLIIIHIDTSGPLTPTFCEKYEALEIFKIFKIEVEKQLGKMIKIVRSNHGGEYYGKYGVT